MTDDVNPEINQRTLDAMDDITLVSSDLFGLLPALTQRPSVAMFGLLMAAAKLAARLSLSREKLHEAIDALYNDALQHEKDQANEH